MAVHKQNIESIDIFFLLNENKIVTRSELKKLLPKENYGDYIKGFYKRRIIDIFQRCRECPWFIDRYLRNKRTFAIQEFNSNKEYLVVYGLHMNDDLCKLQMLQNYVRHEYFIIEGYKLIVIVEMSNYEVDCDVQHLYKRNINTKIIKFDDCPSHIDDKDIAECLSKFYNFNTIGLQTDNICKNVFLYCNVCNIQYNSDLEMMYRCFNHCRNDASRRRKELVKNYEGFQFLKETPQNFILKSNIVKIDDLVFKCAYCEKKFESIEFINKHYEKKHSNELEARGRICQDFYNFVDNLDFAILNVAEGSTEEIPWYVKNLDEKKVIYDMNHMFTGEIQLQ